MFICLNVMVNAVIFSESMINVGTREYGMYVNGTTINSTGEYTAFRMRHKKVGHTHFIALASHQTSNQRHFCNVDSPEASELRRDAWDAISAIIENGNISMAMKQLGIMNVFLNATDDNRFPMQLLIMTSSLDTRKVGSFFDPSDDRSSDTRKSQENKICSCRWWSRNIGEGYGNSTDCTSFKCYKRVEWLDYMLYDTFGTTFLIDKNELREKLQYSRSGAAAASDTLLVSGALDARGCMVNPRNTSAIDKCVHDRIMNLVQTRVRSRLAQMIHIFLLRYMKHATQIKRSEFVVRSFFEYWFCHSTSFMPEESRDQLISMSVHRSTLISNDDNSSASSKCGLVSGVCYDCENQLETLLLSHGSSNDSLMPPHGNYTSFLGINNSLIRCALHQDNQLFYGLSQLLWKDHYFKISTPYIFELLHPAIYFTVLMLNICNLIMYLVFSREQPLNSHGFVPLVQILLNLLKSIFIGYIYIMPYSLVADYYCYYNYIFFLSINVCFVMFVPWNMLRYLLIMAINSKKVHILAIYEKNKEKIGKQRRIYSALKKIIQPRTLLLSFLFIFTLICTFFLMVHFMINLIGSNDSIDVQLSSAVSDHYLKLLYGYSGTLGANSYYDLVDQRQQRTSHSTYRKLFRCSIVSNTINSYVYTTIIVIVATISILVLLVDIIINFRRCTDRGKCKEIFTGDKYFYRIQFYIIGMCICLPSFIFFFGLSMLSGIATYDYSKYVDIVTEFMMSIIYAIFQSMFIIWITGCLWMRRRTRGCCNRRRDEMKKNMTPGQNNEDNELSYVLNMKHSAQEHERELYHLYYKFTESEFSLENLSFYENCGELISLLKTSDKSKKKDNPMLTIGEIILKLQNFKIVYLSGIDSPLEINVASDKRLSFDRVYDDIVREYDVMLQRNENIRNQWSHKVIIHSQSMKIYNSPSEKPNTITIGGNASSAHIMKSKSLGSILSNRNFNFSSDGNKMGREQTETQISLDVDLLVEQLEIMKCVAADNMSDTYSRFLLTEKYYYWVENKKLAEKFIDSIMLKPFSCKALNGAEKLMLSPTSSDSSNSKKNINRSLASDSIASDASAPTGIIIEMPKLNIPTDGSKEDTSSLGGGDTTRINE